MIDSETERNYFPIFVLLTACGFKAGGLFMERNAINEALLNALVDRSLNDIERDPHRSIRKIADLGAHLAHGRFQRHFL